MPDDTKKNQHKGKNDPKDQRKPRRHQAAADKKVEKKVEEPKVTAPPKLAYEEPGPEFYRNLKRETDDILKITEEVTSKYKKKEIQSNWSKYEMPIESYEEIDEQENLGADYEKLIETPLSLGGHFQFKHEKSWDASTAPSLYDKYFDCDMDNLALALSTIPFCDRNCIDQSIFSQNDMLTMNNRATRYKRKYYNDKTFTTSELEAEDTLTEILMKTNEEKHEDEKKDDKIIESVDKRSVTESKETIVLENIQNEPTLAISHENRDCNINLMKDTPNSVLLESNKIDDISCIIAEETKKINLTPIDLGGIEKKKSNFDIDDIILENIETNITCQQPATKPAIEIKTEPDSPKDISNTEKETKTNPVIESPADLEKWLDDFLDG